VSLEFNPGETKPIIFVLKSPYLKKKDLVTEVVISAGQYTQKQGDKVVELDNCMSLMLCGRL
jgi:hypothetical protein